MGLSEAVQVALVTGLFSVVGLLVTGTFAILQVRRKASDAEAAIRTNHGLRPGEYLEMVADVKVMVADLSVSVSDLKHALVEHTAADAEHFGELHADLRAVAAIAERTNDP